MCGVGETEEEHELLAPLDSYRAVLHQFNSIPLTRPYRCLGSTIIANHSCSKTVMAVLIIAVQIIQSLC